jgi:pantetheine-phosphate adenylyltransferase
MTLGHEDLMRRAARLFDRLILAVAAGTTSARCSPSPSGWRSPPRSRAVPERRGHGLPRPAARLRRRVNGQVVVRGLRAVSDFEYEFQMAGMNRQLMPEVETLFMTPSDQYQFVSGTFVREIASLGGDVSKFVAPSVLRRLKERVTQPEAEPTWP